VPLEVRGDQIANAIASPVRVAGDTSLILCLALLVAAVVLLTVGLRSGRWRPARVGLLAVWGASAASIVSAAMLLAALVGGDTSFAYVLENWHSDLSLPYRIAAFWAGSEGSLLLWVVLLLGAAATLAGVAFRRWGRFAEGTALGHGRGVSTDQRSRAPDGLLPLHVGATVVLCVVTLFLVALMVFDRESTPFVAAPNPWQPPAGLNPLLIHPAMALHPPALFLGYVGLAVPFAFAVAALATGRLGPEWASLSRGWLLAGWTFLSLGIGLGAWWAYVILSWGGYWGWDPVESTSLVPWLAATGMLHALAVYRRATVFRRWALALALLTFWCTIVAAWTTRTGVVTSVHAFEQRTLLLVVLSVLLGAVAIAGVTLIAMRWRDLDDSGSSSGRGVAPARLEGRLLLRELLVVAVTLFAGSILFATVVAPLAFGQTVRADTYETLARPLGIVVLAGMGVCAISRAGKAPLHSDCQSRLVRWGVPTAAGVIAAVLLAVNGAAHSAVGLIGLSVCAFATVAAGQWLRRLWTGRRHTRRGAWAALGGVLGDRAFGGVVVHLGMVLTVVGLVGAGEYSQQQQLQFAPEAESSASLGDYRFTLADARAQRAPQEGERIITEMRVQRDGHELGTVGPALDYYARSGQTVARADILATVWRDIFVSPVAFGEQGIVVEAIIFPLVRFLWVGAGLLVVGGLIALWPRRGAALRTTVEAVADGAFGETVTTGAAGKGGSR